MLLKTIYLILLIINISLKLSDSIPFVEFNETNISSQLTELESAQDHQTKLNEASVKTTDLPRNCAEATDSSNESGIYEILIPSYSEAPFRVACDTKTQGGGWTIILSRMDGSVDFYRNWRVYQKGFGDLDGEFFLGLDKVHALTAESSQELLVLLEDFEGDEKYETYEKFAISDEEEQYALSTLGKANGNAGDSLRYHHGMRFTTFDNDNDLHSDKNCAEDGTGAWWYKDCQYSNLAGKYADNTYEKGIIWYSFRGDCYSLKRAAMMIRPRK